MLHTWALVFGLHLWLCGTVPPGPQHAVHIYYVEYDNTFTCKRICWGPGGTMLKNIFHFLYVYYKKWPFRPQNKAVHLMKQKPESNITK